MKKVFKLLAVFSVLMTFLTGCENFLNTNEEFQKLMETEIDYAKAPIVNVLVGHNNDEYGTVGSGVVNYSLTAKVGYAFEVSFALKATAGNFIGWTAYTKYDPDVPANCLPLDESFVEFVDDSRGKLTAKIKLLKEIEGQVRLVPEVSAFPVMEVVLPSELLGITPVPASFNPPQSVKALTPGQEYSVTATTTVDYGFSENAEECWKVYRKDSLGNEIEISDGDKITISKNTGTQLANGRSQSTIYITVDAEFSGRFYVSPKLITYPSMKVEVENFDTSLVKMSHSGTVSMAKGTPYTISLQTDPTTGFKGWRLCKKDNSTFDEISEIFPADTSTTTNINSFTPYSDEYIEVYSPAYEVSETGKSSGKVNASITVILKEDMDELDYSYYLLPQFFKYPVVNIKDPDNYSSAGHFSLTGAGYLDNDTARMMLDDYEYTITYKTTEEFSFAETQWLVYETSNPTKNLAEEDDERIEVTKSSIVTDESGSSTCSVSVILKHDFGTTLNIKPVVTKKPSMYICFADGTPTGINLSLGGNTITSGSVNNKEIKMSTGKIYTATVNVPAGYSFEGWKLVREKDSSNTLNWISESTKSTTDIVEGASLEFDAGALSENCADYIRLYNAKYDFEHEGRNAGTTKATIDVSFKTELSDFSLNLIPVVKAVPEISFVAVDSDYGTLSPSSSDKRNLYTEAKIDLNFKSTKQATAGKEIWKIKKWDSTAYSIDYSENVGYTSLDLTAALKDPVLSTKEIIIYNNDNEGEVQPNSKGEYITTKTAVLYVNRMPEANLQLSVEPEKYNTVKFVPGANFNATAYDSETYIPAGVTLVYELKSKPGYFLDELVIEGGQELDTWIDDTFTDFNGVTTVKGSIKSSSNNGDTVVFTPCAIPISKVTFGQPVLSSNVSTTKEDAGSMVPSTSDFIYQVDGNSTAIRFETTGEYTYEGFAAGTTKFVDVSKDSNGTAFYVLSTGTLAQAKAKAPKADIVIHDLVTTELTDSQGQVKNRVTGTLTVVDRTDDVTVKPLVKGKPSFSVAVAAGKGSVAPSVSKAILINEDYNISYISSADYGFEKWSVTNDGTDVTVLSFEKAKGSEGNSAGSFVVDLGEVQELTGSNSLSNIQTALGSNSTKLLAVIYNSSKVESQSTEGVETVTAKFRIVKDINSAIVVTPVIYKHSYFYLHLKNSADGRFSPISRTLMKAGKDYDFEFVFDGDKYSIGDYSLNSASTFSSGTVYGSSVCAQLSDFSISNWSDYESKKFVIYADTISVNESNNVVTRKGKIRLIKEQTDGVEIHIRPYVSPHNKISLKADTDKVSKIQINDTISTTGSINSYTMIDHKFIPYKSYSISATPVSGKAIYENPEKMWILSNDYSDDLYEYYGSFEFTNGNYTNCDGQEAVFYNCRLEYVGDNLYKACADVIINSDEVQGFTIKPNVYTLPEVNFNSPVTASGSKKGTCLVNEAVPPTSSKLFIGKDYDFVYEADDGYHISSFELYSNSVLKKSFVKTDTSYTNEEVKISSLSFSGDNKVSGKITFLKEAAAAYSFKCNVEPGKPGPVLNIGSGKSFARYDPVIYIYSSSAGKITQYNNEDDTDYNIYASQEFNLDKAQERGYQGETDSESITGYPIAKTGSIRFFINASDTRYKDGTHTPSKVKITERLFYLHPGMLMDYSLNHDYSDFDVIGVEGLQLFDEVGNYIGDSKYQNAKFGLEKTTVINATSLTSYDKTSYTISGYTSYANKISYGGIHQYTVSVLDNEGNESNKFVVYLDVPRTPRTSAEENFITACLNATFWDEGIYIDWTGLGSNPLGENMQVVYSAGQVKASTKEAKLSSGVYKTPLRMYPANSTFKYEICLCDSNGYATVFQESKSYTTERVYEGDLVVRDSQTYKLYYISVDLYLKRKGTLEPVAVVVSKTGKYGAQNNRIIGAGLFDAGDYPFTYSKIWYNQPQTTLYDGRTQFQTWKNNAPYYSSNTYTAANKTVLFNESNFPAIYKATHYGDMLKTKSGVLSSGWYLPDVFEVYGMREPARFKRINRTLTAIDGQPFEYNTGYWSAEYTSPGSGGPRNLLIMTPSNDETAAVAEYDFGYSIEEHHVRAVFDFTEIAEPWPNN